MNSYIVIADVIQAPQMRYTADNQTAIAEMMVQFPGLRDTDPPSRLKVVGWGNMAQRLQEQCKVGDRWVLEGRLRMNLVERPEGFKEKMAELSLSRLTPLGAGVPAPAYAPPVGMAGYDNSLPSYGAPGMPGGMPPMSAPMTAPMAAPMATPAPMGVPVSAPPPMPTYAPPPQDDIPF